jgi:hypothetical protein
MKPERRSMTAALQSPVDLPPEALALIKAGTPKSLSANPVVTSPQSEPPVPVPPPVAIPRESALPANDSVPVEQSPMEGSPRRSRGRPKGSVSRPGGEAERLVGTSYRLPEDLVFRVMKASAERKIRRIHPWAQQDLVAEALTAWLKEAGY